MGLHYDDHKYGHQTQERINIVRTLTVRQRIYYQREVMTKLKKYTRGAQQQSR